MAKIIIENYRTDHAIVELEVNLRFKVQKPHRTEAYNFKSLEGHDNFKQITLNTNNFCVCDWPM